MTIVTLASGCGNTLSADALATAEYSGAGDPAHP